ncbi:DNA-binding response regulator [Opitutaceae bacterium EW11]|nr:DNA-binding response regulator [Opitutaceae bacterium EW11]
MGDGTNLDTSGTVRIFLADDHTLVRQGLMRLLQEEPGFEVVGEASDGREVVESVQTVRPDVVVVDISMPGQNGIRVAQQLRQTVPTAAILGLTVHEEKGYLREFFEAGAAGYLLKRSAAEDLVRAVRTVAAGGFYVDPHLPAKLISAFVHGREDVPGSYSDLSERETEVLRLIALGHSNKEVAAQLDVSVKTVETYKARAMEKLQLRSRVDIIAVAAERGWLPVRPSSQTML